MPQSLKIPKATIKKSLFLFRILLNIQVLRAFVKKLCSIKIFFAGAIIIDLREKMYDDKIWPIEILARGFKYFLLAVWVFGDNLGTIQQ